MKFCDERQRVVGFRCIYRYACQYTRPHTHTPHTTQVRPDEAVTKDDDVVESTQKRIDSFKQVFESHCKPDQVLRTNICTQTRTHAGTHAGTPNGGHAGSRARAYNPQTKMATLFTRTHIHSCMHARMRKPARTYTHQATGEDGETEEQRAPREFQTTDMFPFLVGVALASVCECVRGVRV